MNCGVFREWPRKILSKLDLGRVIFLICMGGGVESNWVHSALRPLIGLLCQPRVIMMMEKLVEWLAREIEVLGENLPQCRSVHKSLTCCPDANPDRRGGKPAINLLSYGTAFLAV
jgi:hypothetical protein